MHPALKESTSDDYAGGYLKDPIPGLYQWVIDLDFTSLYPSIIRSLNIGIETLIGRIVNNGKYDNQWTYEELLDMDQDKMITIEKLNENFTTSRTQVTVGKIVKMIESWTVTNNESVKDIISFNPVMPNITYTIYFS